MATEFGSSYPSLFAMTKRNLFCSDKAQINGIPGVPGVGGCVAPYQYSYAEDRAGFRVRNDPTDARVVCGIDYSGANLCNPVPKTLTFSDNVKQDIRNFRIYVPIGTIGMSVTFYVPNQLNIAAAAQFGQPPLTGLSSDYYSIGGKAPSLKDFSTSAHMVRNWDGLIYLLEDSGISSDNSFLSNLSDKDRFLYVKVVDFSGGYVQAIKYITTVDYKQYLAWYKTMQPQDWKALGEEGSGPVIVSADTPLPQPGNDPFAVGGGGGNNFSVTPPPGNVPPNNPPVNPPIDSGVGKPVEDPFGRVQDSSNISGTGTTIPNNPFFPQQPSGQQPSFPPIFNQPQPSGTSVFNQPMPAQKTSELAAGPIRISWTQPAMELKPVLKTGFVPANPFLPGGGGQQPDFPIGQQVKVYAAYIDSDGKVYVANSNAVFQLYQGGDIPCFTANIRSDAVMWPADSDGINPFASLKGVVVPGRSYIFGVTPANVGSSAEDFMKYFLGTWFQLVN